MKLLRKMNDEKKPLSANLNTILMAVVLAVLSWLGTEVRSTALGLAELRATASVTAKTNAESFARLETAMNGSVSRREYDAKLAAVESELARINIRLRELDVSLMRMQAQSKP
jgi:hypothetical protein